MIVIKKLYKSLAVLLCGVLLSCSLIQFKTVPVQAAYTPSFTQLLDVALNKAGISANLTTLNQLKTEYVSGIRSVLDGYFLWLPDTGYEKNSDSLSLYLNQVPAEDRHNFWSYLFEYCGYADLLFEDGSVNDEKLLAYLVYTFCEKLEGDDYEIPDVNVELNKDVFDDMIEEYTGYYYIKTLTTREILPSYFPTIADYNNLISYINSSDYPTMIMLGTGSTRNNTGTFDCPIACKWVYDNTTPFYIVLAEPSSVRSTIYFYDIEANSKTFDIYGLNQGNWIVPFSDYDGFLEHKDRYYSQVDLCGFYGYIEQSVFAGNNFFIFTEDGRKIKIYKSKGDLMNELAGVHPYHYYINSTYDYSTNNDNSIKISGDYFQDYSQNSYDTITNNTENLNDYSQVDNSITNITNNYYTEGGSGSGDGSGSGSGGSGSGDDSGGTIWDGLSSIIEGLGGILEFLLTLIGEVIQLIASFLTSIMDILGSFKDVGGDFIGFVADFFPFIPQEIWDVILLGVTAGVGIAIWKMFRN